MNVKQNRPMCAWVTLVMMGDSYVPGALILATSLRNVHTEHALLVMVTSSVSNHAKRALSLVYDQVVQVTSLRTKIRPLKGQKQAGRYSESFLLRVFTKWCCLRLTNFDLVCFVDADIAFQRNPDDIFLLRPPAGTFSNPWSFEDRFYNWPLHGSIINHNQIEAALGHDKGFVVFGSLLLLQPDLSLFHKLESIIRKPYPEGYGSQFKTTSGPDELAICELFLGCDWTHIGPKFQAIAWKNYGPDLGIIEPENIIGYHYHGEDKPWDMTPNLWPDLKLWTTTAKFLAGKAKLEGWVEITNILADIRVIR